MKDYVKICDYIRMFLLRHLYNIITLEKLVHLKLCCRDNGVENLEILVSIQVRSVANISY